MSAVSRHSKAKISIKNLLVYNQILDKFRSYVRSIRVITFCLTIYVPDITVLFFAVVSDNTGTLLYHEDVNCCTPVLVAAACEHEDVFHFLMEYLIWIYLQESNF